MVTIGIIGADIMGECVLHAVREQASDLVRVTGTWDPSPEAMARVGGLAPPAASVAALIARAQCVYVASPPAAVRLRDGSVAGRLVDGAWQPDPAAVPNERTRPRVLRRQLEGVARMARGEPHHLATVQEAFEAILRA